jgi:hypothetical protein
VAVAGHSYEPVVQVANVRKESALRGFNNAHRIQCSLSQRHNESWSFVAESTQDSCSAAFV